MDGYLSLGQVNMAVQEADTLLMSLKKTDGQINEDYLSQVGE